MPGIEVILDEGRFPEVAKRLGADKKPLFHTTEDWTLEALENGTTGGKASVMLLIPIKVENIDCLVAAETTLQLWINASTILAARFREQLERPGWVKMSAQTKSMLIPRYAEGIRRAIPTATHEQAIEAATMFISALEADVPPEWITREP